MAATTSGNTLMRTVTLRGVTTVDNQRKGPSKRLTDAEFQAKREKRLCFKCEEKYHVGHRCKAKEQKELRILVEVVENLNIELSINSVVGLTNSGTMKVKDENVVGDFGFKSSHLRKRILWKVEVWLDDWKVVDSFLLLELGGVDVILGIQWLHFFAVTEVDWKHLVMFFQHGGRKVIICGDLSLTKMGVSLKSMMKIW
ncbi:ty3-gypsy retrotransposon protein [Cucumis melo var. makuwa]|uniref:Ty3-gypsy retrotransposon protein n=1 Tax=Cucumis melo var. makuwa TaxID=1194695 RepID=A0A5D3DZS3_CUCMM|nr:ty3-gypsy retrotransposon protein [Cucumis melo var. makuwa]